MSEGGKPRTEGRGSRRTPGRLLLLVGQAASEAHAGKRLSVPRGVLGRGARVSLLVGTVLTAVNHGDRLVAGQLEGWDWLRVAINYLIPFLVASYSGWQATAGKRGADGRGTRP